jgi:signal transduction histidine kinase
MVPAMSHPGGAAVPSPRFVVFNSLRNKLLTLMITLSMLPLLGMLGFSYYTGSRQIQDRIRLSLEKMAQDTADKIDLTLREKKEEVHAMASTFPFIRASGRNEPADLRLLLNNYCFIHEVYDLLIVLDEKGNIAGINSVDRNGAPLSSKALESVRVANIAAYAEENKLFRDSITGHSSHLDWYQSGIVRQIYDYQSDDVSRQYNIALSEPVRDLASHEIVGVWINIINWTYFQNILDNVEMDLANLDLATGYAFMFARDANTIIGHKYRNHRKMERYERSSPEATQSLYGTKLIETHGLQNLHDALIRKDHSFSYEFPRGNGKTSGLAPIEDTSFGWIVGVGIDSLDIFRPIRAMTGWLLVVTVALALLAIAFTYVIAEGITVPLKNLIGTARTIAQGNLTQRVQTHSRDEVGILGATFNDMAESLASREEELRELNKNLEQMVLQRTGELENSHEALRRAYIELQNAHEQLVQTEKMASLGQLVAGIAHEIKNPLNFIYGNTGFLSEYVEKLQSLLEAVEALPSLSGQDRARIADLKAAMRYSFIKDDLRILIGNFAEGAERINNIVSDLRTFSRIDTDIISEIDLHASLEMSLSLLRNQYRDRITVHREYGNIPKIQGFSGKVSQVFMNLLANAFHAISARGDVWIRTRSNGESVEVEIQDNGSGIAPEHMKRIFEPFFTTKPVGQGTGLGLSISYGIIEQHHGKILVTSTPPKGSVFTVRLPVVQQSQAAEGEAR